MGGRQNAAGLVSGLAGAHGKGGRERKYGDVEIYNCAGVNPARRAGCGMAAGFSFAGR